MYFKFFQPLCMFFRLSFISSTLSDNCKHLCVIIFKKSKACIICLLFYFVARIILEIQTGDLLLILLLELAYVRSDFQKWQTHA